LRRDKEEARRRRERAAKFLQEKLQVQRIRKKREEEAEAQRKEVWFAYIRCSLIGIPRLT
jgi:hypothetical protein